jgi:hypothetical protein
MPPKLKKRTALFEKLSDIFRQHVSWPVENVIEKINPILRGWVNYFGSAIRVLFWSGQTLGRGEGSATFDACPGTQRFRLDAVE